MSQIDSGESRDTHVDIAVEMQDHQPTQQEKNLEDGAALVRVVRELREHFEDQELPQSFVDDLATIERVGRWLGGARVIDGTALGFRVTGLR